MVRLVATTRHYANSIAAYKKAFLNTQETMDGCTFLREYDNLDDWLQMVEQLRQEQTTPKHLCTAHSFLLLKDYTVIGMCDLRLNIEKNEYLREIGGHIGYSIHPNYRQRGYATKQLALLLQQAKQLGFQELNISCNEANSASRKVIEANGGQFIDCVDDNGEKVRRYKIVL